MIGRASSFLGLAFSDSRITCAEVSTGGDRRVIRHIATFPFTPEQPLEKPDTTGLALATFLREHKFTASRVVAGVPARWLIASEKDLPPANEQIARAALALHAERAAGDGSDMVFDFSGEPNPQAPTKVLLVGIVRTQFDRVSRLLDVAGLNVIAITSTGLTLASNIRSDVRDGAMLVLAGTGAEMVVRSDGTPRSLRHVSMTANGHGIPAIGPLGAELRRAMALGASNGSRQMLLLDSIGLDEQQIGELSSRAGVELRPGDELKLLNATPDASATARISGSEPGSLASFAPAVSLAIAANRPDDLPLDFSHSRLTVETKKKLGRNAYYGIAAAVVVLIGIVYLWMQLNTSQKKLDQIKGRLAGMTQQVSDADRTVTRVETALNYYDKRPSELECLRQFTLMFRDDEKIWVNSFNLKDNGKGSVSGKAADQETALKMIERLKKNPKFASLEKLDVHEADARTHEWQFSFNFTYNFAD